MTFIDDNGNELNFDGSFAMTKKAVSFFNGSIQGDVSITFQVDNNSVNREVLNYQGPQMLNQVAFTKQAFNRVRNGNILDRGYIVIQSESEDSLNCFYVSGNSNWIQLLQDSINQYDFSSYATKISQSNVVNLISATEGIVFPFVDWAYNFKKGLGSEYLITQETGTNFVEYLNSGYSDFFPCFYYKSLLDQISNETGLKFSGSLLSDNLFKSLVITPESGQIKRSSNGDVSLIGSSQSYAGFATAKYTSFTVISDINNAFTNNTYTAKRRTRLYFYFNFTSLSGTGWGIVIYRNGAIESSISTFTANNSTYLYKTLYNVDINIGDTYEIYLTNADAGVQSVTLNLKIVQPEIINTYDFVTPNNFLPNISSIDYFKFLINFFGCSVYFDEVTKTITANIIEKIKTEDAEDWSEYYISHRNEFTVQQAKNNFLRWNFNDPELQIEKYNRQNNPNFAEGNIETRNTLKENNEMLSFPFQPSFMDSSIDSYNYPSIPLVKFTDSGEVFSFTSIANSGAGQVQINGITPDVFGVNEIWRVVISGQNVGYFLLTVSATTQLTGYMTFTISASGTLYRQNIEYNSGFSRILSVKPSTNATDISTLSTVNTLGSNLGHYSTSTIMAATFTKSKTGSGIDNWKNNLAIDNPDSGGFTDPTIKELYFNKISRFLQNPNIRASMLLPEAVYQRFKFDQFIYLKTERLTGYFFVDSIVNYVDSTTPVEVNLLML